MAATYPNHVLGALEITRELVRLRVQSFERKQRRAEHEAGADSPRAKQFAARAEKERARLAHVTERAHLARQRVETAAPPACAPEPSGTAAPTPLSVDLFLAQLNAMARSRQG